MPSEHRDCTYVFLCFNFRQIQKAHVFDPSAPKNTRTKKGDERLLHDACMCILAIGKIMLCGTENIVEMFLDEAVQKKKAKTVSYP
jgi:hypothetical protein